jgi:hypothetical protein
MVMCDRPCGLPKDTCVDIRGHHLQGEKTQEHGQAQRGQSMEESLHRHHCKAQTKVGHQIDVEGWSMSTTWPSLVGCRGNVGLPQTVSGVPLGFEQHRKSRIRMGGPVPSQVSAHGTTVRESAGTKGVPDPQQRVL